MLDAWLDLVHGSGCVCCGLAGRLLCPACARTLPVGGHEVRPSPCPEGLAPTFAAGEYADQLRAMIVAHKEEAAFALCRPLGRILTGVLEVLLAETFGACPPADGLVAAQVLLVPVPSRAAVVRRRGHDPMLRITRCAAQGLRRTGLDVCTLPLLRQRDVLADQAGLDAAARAANLEGRMAVRERAVDRLARTAGPVVALLCDDVITTGSTAREGQRALQGAGIVVGGIGCIAATRKRFRIG